MNTFDEYMAEQSERLAKERERIEGENLRRVIAKDKEDRERARTSAIVRLDMARQEINHIIGDAERQAAAAIRKMMANAGGNQPPRTGD